MPKADTRAEQSNLAESDCARYTRASVCFPVQFPVIYAGLMTSPCHGLVDTGAQDGVIGLWHWQRWVVCLALFYKLQPAFLPLPESREAGGIGGTQKIVAICDMPTGLAGLNGITRWAVLDEPDTKQRVPPLVPIKLLKMLDAVHEPKHLKLTLREANKVAHLEELLPSEHQTMSLMDMDADGWHIREDVLAELEAQGNGDIFCFKENNNPYGDERLNPSRLVERCRDFMDDEALQTLSSQVQAQNEARREAEAAQEDLRGGRVPQQGGKLAQRRGEGHRRGPSDRQCIL